jgi:hypothetical protein
MPAISRERSTWPKPHYLSVIWFTPRGDRLTPVEHGFVDRGRPLRGRYGVTWEAAAAGSGFQATIARAQIGRY